MTKESTGGFEIVDTDTTDLNHPVIQGLYQTIFEVAGLIQPSQPEAFAAAIRVTELIQKGANLDKINMDDVGLIFRAAGRFFKKINIP